MASPDTPKPPEGTTKVPSSVCPRCGYYSDAATDTSRKNAQPLVGDFSICFNCGQINRFGSLMQLKRVTEHELINELELHQRVKIRLMQASIVARGLLVPERNPFGEVQDNGI